MAVGPLNINQLPGLKALFHLADTNDAGPNGYGLTNTGVVAFNPGIFGVSAYFDGTDKRLTRTTLDASNAVFGIPGNTPAFYSMWVKANPEIASGTYGIFIHGDTTSSRMIQVYYEYNSGTRRLVLDNAGTTATFNVALGLTKHHIVAIRGASNVASLYLDGKLVISGLAQGTTAPGGERFFLGEDNSTTFIWNGTIDECAVSNNASAMTPEQIRDYYAWGIGRRIGATV